MKKNMIFIIILFIMLMISGCSTSSKSIKVEGKNINYSIKVPYFGNITIGKKSFNMLSTEEELEKAGFENSMFYSFLFNDNDDPKSKFLYNIENDSEAYSVNFTTHSDIYKKNGCIDCDEYLSHSLELPKNITYNSTIDDVIKAYGEPKEKNDDTSDGLYHLSDTNSGTDFGYFDCKTLLYEYKNENSSIELYLYFDNNDNKLFKVEYSINVNNK